MKKAITVAAVLITVTLGAYLGFGILARQNCQRAIAELEATFPGQIHSSYRQGLFSAELELTLAIPIPAANPESPPTISSRIRQTIHHGPFVLGAKRPISSLLTPVQLYAQGTLTVEPFMADEPAFVAQLRELATTEITVHSPLKGRTEVSFQGKARRDSLVMGSETFALNWQGFRGTLMVEGSNMLTYDLDFQAPGLAIKGNGPAGLALEIEGITSQARMHEGSHHLSLGTVTAAMEKFEAILGHGATEKIALTGLQLDITSREQNALLQVEEDISMGHLHFADKTFGPANLKITLANLDAQTVTNLSEAYKELQNSPDKTEAMNLGLLSGHAMALLAKSPEIRLENFSLASPEGACLSSARIAFNGEGEVIMNPLFLLGRLSVEAAFSADEHFMAVQTKNFLKESLCAQRPDAECDQEAATASSQQLQALIEQNILLLDAGKYRMTASFQNGQPMLNGKAVPLSF